MLELTLPTMTCGHCVSVVTKAIKQTDPRALVEIGRGDGLRRSLWCLVARNDEVIELRRHELARLPLPVFSVHMQALGDDAASQATRAGYTKAVRAVVNPRDDGPFAGKVDPSTLSFFERLAVKLVKSSVGRQARLGSYPALGRRTGGEVEMTAMQPAPDPGSPDQS